MTRPDVGIIGTDRILPAGARLVRPLRHATISLGEPIRTADAGFTSSTNRARREITDRFMRVRSGDSVGRTTSTSTHRCHPQPITRAHRLERLTSSQCTASSPRQVQSPGSSGKGFNGHL